MFGDLLALRDQLRAVLAHFQAKEIGKGIAAAGKVLVTVGGLIDVFDGGTGPAVLVGAAGGDVDAALAECTAAAEDLCPRVAGAGTDVAALPAGIDTTGLDPATIQLILMLLQTFGPMVMKLIERIIERRRQNG